jgi:hypothetical protein
MDLKKTVVEIADAVEDATEGADDDYFLIGDERVSADDPRVVKAFEEAEARSAAEDERVARMRDEALATLQRFDEPVNLRWGALADAIGKLLADDSEIADEDAIMRHAELIGTRIVVRAIMRRRASWSGAQADA